MVQMECNGTIVGIKDITAKNGKNMRMIHVLYNADDRTWCGQKTAIAWSFEGGTLFSIPATSLIDARCVVAEISGKVAIVAIEDVD